jgi:hypothetical protein
MKDEEILLYTRKEVANLLNIGISSLDLIPICDLPRVKIGRSVRFTKKAILNFILNNEYIKENKYE